MMEAVVHRNESWLPVVGFEGLYEISSLGRVRSLDRVGRDRWGERIYRGRILKPSPHVEFGHMRVALYREGVKSRHMVHRLVLEAFVDPCPEGLEGCHNDGDPTNNAIENLRWDTHAANLRDRLRHGTHPGLNKTACLRGHAFTVANTYWHRGARSCKTCRQEAARACRERKAAA